MKDLKFNRDQVETLIDFLIATERGHHYAKLLRCCLKILFAEDKSLTLRGCDHQWGVVAAYTIRDKKLIAKTGSAVHGGYLNYLPDGMPKQTIVEVQAFLEMSDLIDKGV